MAPLACETLAHMPITAATSLLLHSLVELATTDAMTQFDPGLPQPIVSTMSV